MQQGAKSSLILRQQPKKQVVVEQPSGNEIEYKQIGSIGQYKGELSDQEKEAEFNQLHDQYIQVKINRKKQLMRMKKQQFGTSSSDEQDSSQEEIGQQKISKKQEVKKSKGKQSSKSELIQEQFRFAVVLELRKLVSQTQLVFLEKEFQINKKILLFTKITRLSISVCEKESRIIKRLRVGIGNDEDVILSCPQSLEKSKDKLLDIFMKFFRIKLNQKGIKLVESTKIKAEQFGELGEEALICGKIYKKSQIIRTWQQRYIVIKNDGIHSFRTLKSKQTMYIPTKQISQVQTQFQFYKEQLIVKIIYSNNTKTDFGLPLDSMLIWVKQFANLIRI